jgi:hypothetical protein
MESRSCRSFPYGNRPSPQGRPPPGQGRARDVEIFTRESPPVKGDQGAGFLTPRLSYPKKCTACAAEAPPGDSSAESKLRRFGPRPEPMRNIFQQLGMGQAGGKVFTANASGAHFSQAHLLAVGAGMALYVICGRSGDLSLELSLPPNRAKKTLYLHGVIGIVRISRRLPVFASVWLWLGKPLSAVAPRLPRQRRRPD